MVIPLVSTGSAAALAELCRRAEATGADSLWAVDHLYWPHPIAEALTTLAVAATATARTTLGTCVLQLPLRRPAAVAKQATALQLLSGGRFVLGLGVGSHRREYERAGVDFTAGGGRSSCGEGGAPQLPPRRRCAGAPSDYVQDPASAADPPVVRGFERGRPPPRRRGGRRLGAALRGARGVLDGVASLRRETSRGGPRRGSGRAGRGGLRPCR